MVFMTGSDTLWSTGHPNKIVVDVGLEHGRWLTGVHNIIGRQGKITVSDGM